MDFKNYRFRENRRIFDFYRMTKMLGAGKISILLKHIA